MVNDEVEVKMFIFVVITKTNNGDIALKDKGDRLSLVND